MGQPTPLYDVHIALGAKMVERDGWEMPLHYGDQVDEHHQVRAICGVFDVSYLCVVDVYGSAAEAWLYTHLSNNVRRLEQPGQAQYSLLLSETGGVLADVLVYRLHNGFRLITDPACKTHLLSALHAAATDMQFTEQTGNVVLLAIQGPEARERCARLVSSAQAAVIEQLLPFQAREVEGWFIARTGFTGEDGVEILLSVDDAVTFFYELIGAGIPPIGLAARDTLRIEAGFCQYGQDLTVHTSPLSLSLEHVIAWEPQDRAFTGRAALEQTRAEGGDTHRLVGLILEERGILRHGDTVRVEGLGSGMITSGSFSPTLGKIIALAQVPAGTSDRAEVEVRGKWYLVRVVRPGFVRHGTPLI